MKNLALLLCLSVLLKPLFPVIEYAFNYDYIAGTLCENKDKVEMKCNGKCYLIKQMAKESDSQKPFSPDKKHLETPDLFFYTVRVTDALHLVFFSIRPVDAYDNTYLLQGSCEVFRPPCAVV